LTALTSSSDVIHGAGMSSSEPNESVPSPQRYTSASVRAFLTKVLLTDSDLEMLCIDHFPEVKALFTNGMDRQRKINLLFEYRKPDEIVSKLFNSARTRYTTYESMLIREDGAQAATPRPQVADRDTIYRALCQLLASELSEVIFSLRINNSLLSGPGTPRNILAQELVQLYERQGEDGLARLAAAIRKIAPNLLS
jgi:hypothetical protein